MANASIREYLQETISRLEAERMNIDADLDACRRVLALVAAVEKGADSFPSKDLPNEILQLKVKPGEPVNYRELFRTLQDPGSDASGEAFLLRSQQRGYMIQWWQIGAQGKE